MQQPRIRRNARRALARLTRTCAAALEQLAARVEPARAQPPDLSDSRPPRHWLEDIQQHGGPLDWVRFSARERGRLPVPREPQSTVAERPHAATLQPVVDHTGTPRVNEPMLNRPRFTVRRQPIDAPTSTRQEPPPAAEPRVTLRYAPRRMQPDHEPIQRRAAMAEPERGDHLQRDRLATAASRQHPPSRPVATSPVAFTLDTRAPADLFPDWPAATAAEQPIWPSTSAGGIPKWAERAVPTTLEPWRSPDRLAHQWEPTWSSSAPATPAGPATPVAQPWPALPDSTPEIVNSEQPAWEWARGRRQEQHLRRLEHEQRGAPWSEWLS